MGKDAAWPDVHPDAQTVAPHIRVVCPIPICQMYVTITTDVCRDRHPQCVRPAPDVTITIARVRAPNSPIRVVISRVSPSYGKKVPSYMYPVSITIYSICYDTRGAPRVSITISSVWCRRGKVDPPPVVVHCPPQS